MITLIYLLYNLMLLVYAPYPSHNALLAEDSSIRENYLNQIEGLKTSKDIKDKLKKELERGQFFDRTDRESADIRKYLITVLELPWGKISPTPLVNLNQARQILDQDHYGLEEIKERIIDHLAVINKLGFEKAPILCFVGPPGVGKTSIARSIARILKKNFDRISLGGVHDESVIRGTLRYYVGSKPGRLMTILTKAKALNPVILLDEIDKIKSDANAWSGDVNAALLEVLDPEQNKEFVDNYIDLPFDLSKVIFITTANNLGTIPRPIRDRLEIIEIESYSLAEKVEITKRYLWPKNLKENKISDNLILPDESIQKIILDYTYESGVRELERQIEKICQKIIRQNSKFSSIDIDIIPQLLGPKKYIQPLYEKSPQIGSVVGAYWSEIGGGTLLIEGSLIPGAGETILSGNLGKMTIECMKAAVIYIKSQAKKYDISEKTIKDNNLYLHFPDIGVPKDGPSAGLAVACLTYSVFSNKPLRQDVAITGELSLHGKVLPVGGIKNKIIAAQQAGMAKILIPVECASELEKLTPLEIKNIEIVLIKNFEDALSHIL